jgi:hypothetical protein
MQVGKITLAVVLIWLGVHGAFAGEPGGDESPSPQEQYQAILDEYTKAAAGGAASDGERRKLIARVDQLREGLAQRFLELAQKYPDDPVAVDSLTQAVWMANHSSFPTEGPDGPGRRAMTLLLRDYAESDRLGPICLRIANCFGREYEEFLRGLLARSPHDNVQGLATLALAQFLKDRTRRLDQLGEMPELAGDYERIFGREFLDELSRQDRGQVDAEIVSLLERAASEYSEVKIPYGATVAAQAKAELFEFRYLAVGQEAPEIEGVDQFGVRFKLGDYRGLVVLLDFWHEY